MKLGQTIRTLRKEKGLSQQDFAELAGMTQTGLSQIENDLIRPQQATLDKICQVLDVQEYLLVLLSIDEEDVPLHKRDQFRLVFPTVKDLLVKLFYSEEKA